MVNIVVSVSCVILNLYILWCVIGFVAYNREFTKLKYSPFVIVSTTVLNGDVLIL